MKKALFIILLIALLAGLLAAGPIISAAASTRAMRQLDPPAILLPGQTIGQTFFSAHAGLREIRVYLYPGADEGGTLRLTLLTSPEAQEPVAVAALPLQEITQPGEYTFRFTPLAESYLRSYYARFEITGSGAAGFQRLEPVAYYEGAMYQDEVPVQSQLSFFIDYDPVQQRWGIARQVSTWLGDIGLALLLFVLPGWAILSLSVRRFADFSFGEKLGAGAGASVALYPLILVWADFASFQPGRWLVWAVLAFDALFLIYAAVRFFRTGRQQRRPLCIAWDDVALIVLIGLLLFTRLWAVRTLPSPLGLDSVQHGAITRLILDNGGLFQSWMPYTPYKSFTMHFGFHVLSALFQWISGREVQQAILIVGQLANVLAVLALYPLAVAVTGGKRWAGVGAVAAAGLLSPMPAFYVNWGRYPQLAGMLLLPAALWFMIKSLESKKDAPVMIVLAAATLASMFLSYYRLPFFYVTFVLAWLVCFGISRIRLSLRPWLVIALRLGLIAVLSLILVGPWLGRLASSRLNNEEIHGTLSTTEDVVREYQKWSDVLFHAPVPLLAAAGLGVVASLLRRNGRQLSPLVWILGLFGIVALALLKIPGADLMQTGAIMIVLYAPLSLLAGILLAEIRDWAIYDWPRARRKAREGSGEAPAVQPPFADQPLAGPAPSTARKPLLSWSTVRTWRAGEAVLALFVILAALRGVPEMSGITNWKNHGFLTWADLKAMAWINENLPEDARFFVESQRFKGTSAIGGDAGWWLPILTGRPNNMPPQYALVMEYPDETGYNDKVVNWTYELEEVNFNQPEGIRLLCEGGFQYIYMGQKIFYADAQARYSFFTVQELSSSPDLRPLYRQDLISIYELVPGACEGIPR